MARRDAGQTSTAFRRKRQVKSFKIHDLSTTVNTAALRGTRNMATEFFALDFPVSEVATVARRNARPDFDRFPLEAVGKEALEFMTSPQPLIPLLCAVPGIWRAKIFAPDLHGVGVATMARRDAWPGFDRFPLEAAGREGIEFI